MNDPLVASVLNSQLSISLEGAAAEVGSLNQEPLKDSRQQKSLLGLRMLSSNVCVFEVQELRLEKPKPLLFLAKLQVSYLSEL